MLHTLLVVPDSTVTANPHLFSKLAYDPIKDLSAIIALCRITPVLVVNPSVPASNVQELIALAKAKPGTLNYGSYGIGTYAHLSMEDFKRRTGTDIVHIPYRGAAPATTGLLAGDVSMLLLHACSPPIRCACPAAGDLHTWFQPAGERKSPCPGTSPSLQPPRPRRSSPSVLLPRRT
jgi:hypothetical protein